MHVIEIHDQTFDIIACFRPKNSLTQESENCVEQLVRVVFVGVQLPEAGGQRTILNFRELKLIVFEYLNLYLTSSGFGYGFL